MVTYIILLLMVTSTLLSGLRMSLYPRPRSEYRKAVAHGSMISISVLILIVGIVGAIATGDLSLAVFGVAASIVQYWLVRWREESLMALPKLKNMVVDIRVYVRTWQDGRKRLAEFCRGRGWNLPDDYPNSARELFSVLDHE